MCGMNLVAHFAKKTTLINPLEQVFNVNITHLTLSIAKFIIFSDIHKNSPIPGVLHMESIHYC